MVKFSVYLNRFVFVTGHKKEVFFVNLYILYSNSEKKNSVWYMSLTQKKKINKKKINK